MSSDSSIYAKKIKTNFKHQKIHIEQIIANDSTTVLYAQKY